MRRATHRRAMSCPTMRHTPSPSHSTARSVTGPTQAHKVLPKPEDSLLGAPTVKCPSWPCHPHLRFKHAQRQGAAHDAPKVLCWMVGWTSSTFRPSSPATRILCPAGALSLSLRIQEWTCSLPRTNVGKAEGEAQHEGGKAHMSLHDRTDYVLVVKSRRMWLGMQYFGCVTVWDHLFMAERGRS